MQIQSGKLYENKTWDYLYPCLKRYGQDLKTYLNSLFKLAVGISDSNTDIEESYCIYILVDTKVISSQVSLQSYRENLTKFLDWVRFQPYYVIDYIYEGLNFREKHMIVLKLPKSAHSIYDNFISGKYSEMYSTKEIDEIFAPITSSNKELQKKVNTKNKKIRDILKKSSEYLPVFKEIVNEEFGTNLTSFELRNHELDLPPNLEQEIFNYNGIRQ